MSQIEQNPRVYIGKNVTQGQNIGYGTGEKGYITISDNCFIGGYVQFSTHDGFIEVGENCFIGSFCVLYGHGGLKIVRLSLM